jgi:hypothetical protein
MLDKKNYLDLEDDEELIDFSDAEIEIIENKPSDVIKEIEEDGEECNISEEEVIEELDEIEELENDLDELENDDIDLNEEIEENEIEEINDYILDDNVTEVDGDFDLIYRLNTNKHRQEGKHTLQRDTIFKGKLEEKQDTNENGYTGTDMIYNDNFKLFDVEFDSYTDDYLNQNNLTKDVFEILDTKTDLDFRQNRRKPNKETFNNYYNLLLKELGFRYTKSEIFVELSYYFTDNIFNMFKLLDKRPATIIIKELMQKGYLKNINGIDFL